MSDKLKKSLRTKPEQPKVWCLSPTDWQTMLKLLGAAEELFKTAEVVTPEQWAEWTSEFGEGQGFNSIIYHDRPIIAKPLGIDKHKAM